MIRAVIFDIGGVLEVTPPTGHTERWEAKLGPAPGELDRTMADVWWGGSLGTLSKPEVLAAFAERLRLSPQQVDEVKSFVGAREREQQRYGFDDREGAVDGARAVGMAAVLFRDNAQAVADLEAVLRPAQQIAAVLRPLRRTQR